MKSIIAKVDRIEGRFAVLELADEAVDWPVGV